VLRHSQCPANCPHACFEHGGAAALRS
jgi:hypothetical protein